MTTHLPLAHYPFMKQSQEILSELNITFETIDTTNTYDEILREAFYDITDAVTRKKLDSRLVISSLRKTTKDREIAKFYLSLMIIKTSTILTNLFIRYYIKKFQIILDDNLKNINIKTSIDLNIYYIELFHEFGLEWILVKLNDLVFAKIHMNNYLDFATLIQNNDPPEYQLLTLTNCSLNQGFVYFYSKDYTDFQRMLNKLLEERIRKLVTNTQEKIECQKIEKCRLELSKYMKDKDGLSYSPFKKQYEENNNYEPTTQDLLRNETILKLFKDKQNLESLLPPCIWVILDQIHRKQELVHNQNILLASYLTIKGFTEDQIHEVYKQTVNYNERVARYNIKYIMKKQIKPMNCQNLLPENLCNKEHDRTGQCVRINNPLSYKEMINKKNE